MTRTGVFIRCMVCTKTARHCAADKRSTRPEMSPAANTPVPAAESQLMVKRAASGRASARRALRAQEEARLGMPDEADEERRADHGKDARHDVGHEMELVRARGEPLHDGERTAGDERGRPHFEDLLPRPAFHLDEG